MNCIQPIAPAEETLRLVPKAVSTSLIPASTAGALRAEAVGGGGPLVDRDQDRRARRPRRSWSSGSRGSRRSAAAARRARRAPPSGSGVGGSAFGFARLLLAGRGAAGLLRLGLRGAFGGAAARASVSPCLQRGAGRRRRRLARRPRLGVGGRRRSSARRRRRFGGAAPAASAASADARRPRASARAGVLREPSSSAEHVGDLPARRSCPVPCRAAARWSRRPAAARR